MYVRIILAVLVIYFILSLLKRFIRVVQGLFHQNANNRPPEESVKPKETYKDVQDAKFVEIPNKNNENAPSPEP